MIRPAVAGDAAVIARLEAVLFGADAWTPEQVLSELVGPGRRGWVSIRSLRSHSTTREELATADSTSREGLDGYVITWDSGDVVDLQRIGVHPDAQRTGLATELLATATSGVARMLLEVAEDNEAALAFYAQRGFVEIDRRPRYYRSGAAAVVMQLDPGGQGR